CHLLVRKPRIHKRGHDEERPAIMPNPMPDTLGEPSNVVDQRLFPWCRILDGRPRLPDMCPAESRFGASRFALSRGDRPPDPSFSAFGSANLSAPLAGLASARRSVSRCPGAKRSPLSSPVRVWLASS